MISLGCWQTNRNVRSSRIRFDSPRHCKSWPIYFTSSLCASSFLYQSTSFRQAGVAPVGLSWHLTQSNSVRLDCSRFGQYDSRPGGSLAWLHPPVHCRWFATKPDTACSVQSTAVAVCRTLQYLAQMHKYFSQHHIANKNFTGIICRSKMGLPVCRVARDVWYIYSEALRYETICFVSHRNLVCISC